MSLPPGPLVSAAWLREHLGDGGLRVVDLRWHLAGPSGREQYLAGHIPGAVFVDLDGDISGEHGAGRHPLPTKEQFQAAMRRAGVSRETSVVVYDDEGGSVAGRLWFLLRAFGHPAVAVLDGGLQAWGEPLESGPGAVPAPGGFDAAPPDWSQVALFDEVAALPAGTVLLDARAGERYRGEIEPIDPKAGHIPGARSAPWKENLGPDGRFLAPDQLRAKFAQAGVTGDQAVVAYCGSGVTSVHHLLAMEVAGLPAPKLYAGSWSDWCAHPGAPVATGSD